MKINWKQLDRYLTWFYLAIVAITVVDCIYDGTWDKMLWVIGSGMWCVSFMLSQSINKEQEKLLDLYHWLHKERE